MKSKKIISMLCACLMLSVVFASPVMATSNASNSSQAKLSTVAKPAEIKTLEGAKLVEITKDKKLKDATLIIDVRPENEYLEGHILNAINIPVDTLESRLDEVSDMKDKPVVVYCNSGKKSKQAAEILVKYGFTDVSDADGVKKFTYDLAKFPNIRGAQFKKMIDEKADVQIIDIRPGKDVESGLIKGAKHIPLDELQGRLGEIQKDKKVVVYCNTGTKSVDAAKILSDAGFDVTNVIEGTKEFTYDLVKPQ